MSAWPRAWRAASATRRLWVADAAAPVVVAKGQGHLAQRIKKIARESGVPMVENVPLAQALYKTVEVGESIPGNLFEAVAEVLAYLIRLKQLTLN